MIDEEEKKFIARDTDFTKYFLWSAYEGYTEHYGDFIMYERQGTVPVEITAGLYKYMVKFYHQIKTKYKKFPNIKEEDFKKYQAIKKKEEPNGQDYEFIMEFIETFMDESGIKNIIFKEDNPGRSVEQNR